MRNSRGKVIYLLLLALSAPAATFDYYVLSLSWSPEYCAGPNGSRSPQQCSEGRRYGFVVHGLWPQNERGWLENCPVSDQPSEALVNRLLPLMPSRPLIRHEWSKHGSCSGMKADQYFSLIEQTYRGVHIPQRYRQPKGYVTVPPRELERDFLAVNAGWRDSGVAIVCRGQYLSEVRVCLDKDMKPRQCGPNVRDQCKADKAVLRPVR